MFLASKSVPSNDKSVALSVTSPLLENKIAVSAMSSITSSLPVGSVTLPVPAAERSKSPEVAVIKFASMSILSTRTLPTLAVPNAPVTASVVIVASGMNLNSSVGSSQPM